MALFNSLPNNSCRRVFFTRFYYCTTLSAFLQYPNEKICVHFSPQARNEHKNINFAKVTPA
jgi:hypothetical protein